MLVVVKKPPIEFTIEGNIPEKLLKFIKKDYGEDVTIEDDGDELVLATEMEWYKEEKAKQTPGGNMCFYRRLHKLTQQQLGKKLEITKQEVSNMENNIVPISRQMAHKLAEIFNVHAEKFI